MKEETLKQICKMIASGEIPKEVYDKYLSKCPIGFMKEEELFRYLTQLETNWKGLKKWLEEESTKTIYQVGHLTSICATLSKMKELENKDVNNK